MTLFSGGSTGLKRFAYGNMSSSNIARKASVSTLPSAPTSITFPPKYPSIDIAVTEDTGWALPEAPGTSINGSEWSLDLPLRRLDCPFFVRFVNKHQSFSWINHMIETFVNLNVQYIHVEKQKIIMSHLRTLN